MDYLDEFEDLEYSMEPHPGHEDVPDTDAIHLKNLKALGGMEVAELLTYLYDDGYVHFGPMDATSDNGALIMLKQ